MEDTDSTFEIAQIINNFKSIDKLKEQIKFVLLYIYQLDSTSQNLFYNETLMLEGMLKDVDFFRRVERRDALAEKHPVEYFGRDYDFDDPFLFDAEIEARITKVNLDLLAILGRVLTMLKKAGFSLDKEM